MNAASRGRSRDRLAVTWKVHNGRALWSDRTLDDWLADLVAEIVAAIAPRAVWPFGSVARRDDDADSDIDLLVVLDDTDQRLPADLQRLTRTSTTTPVPYDLAFTSASGFAQRSGSPARSSAPRPETVGRCMSGPDNTDASTIDAGHWLAKAADNLIVAHLVLDAADAPRWPACFHAQRSAEKALKAYLVAFGIDFPLSHALDRLADLAGGCGLVVNRAALTDLQPWAVAGRYPEDIGDPTPADALALVAAADQLVDDIRRALERSN